MAHITAFIVAAGKGTRMKSSLPKVMHKIVHLPMIEHVALNAKSAGISDLVYILAKNHQYDAQKIAIQKEQLGTGHAVQIALQQYPTQEGKIIILYGDTPLITPSTIQKMIAALDSAPLIVLGFEPANAAQYGRLKMKDGTVSEIVEYIDANEEERNIKLCNSGVIAADAALLNKLLPKINNCNAKKEYYLTDLVALNGGAGLVIASEDEVMGVNDRAQLARAENIMQERLRKVAMENGVTMIDPSSVYLAYDTKFGRDIILEPNIYFGPNVEIEDNVEIKFSSHIEGAIICSGSRIGPFARIRPSTKIGQNSKIGNFVEVKNAKIGESVGINHLSYIGDAAIGRKTNIGAGTITCNYDGIKKSHTIIGENVFIGSNSALIAPVEIGDGALIAAGSTITHNVPANSKSFARARQENKHLY